jgi:hypothetical protein
MVMLTRDGQPCQRAVPDYPGRLTDFEFLAYCVVFESVADDFKRVAALNSALADLEHSRPRLANACAGPERDDPEIVPASDGLNWELVGTLLKFDRTALLLCRREIHGEREFSIIQRLDPSSPLAQAKGIWQVQMTSNDARVMLQDFVESERQALKLYAGDIVAIAREAVEHLYPGQNLGRVIEAISQRCAKDIAAEKATPVRRHVRRQSEGVRV